MLADLHPSQEMLTRKIGRIQDKPLSVKKIKDIKLTPYFVMNTGSGSYDLQAETKEYSKIFGLSSGSNFCG